MRIFKNPKITYKKAIKDKHKDIGYLQLVLYCDNRFPHLEYSVDEEYQGKGIMSRELPKYLRYLKRKQIFQIIAIVKKDNEISKKLLAKNDFVKLYEYDEKEVYITDLNYSIDFLKKVKTNFDKKNVGIIHL